ncbi:hypothetical protein FBR02_00610 [Anaerolineae bacterium CFX9]|nr:hypothetical protein [Anaerolineae bacterium CFX9]
MPGILQLAWKRFRKVSEIYGDYQGRAIATIFYFTIVAPFALFSRFRTDPLLLKPTTPAWLEREPVDNQLEAARRQG